ncbi:hypothetical protein PS1_042421 [Malus domestica]
MASMAREQSMRHHRSGVVLRWSSSSLMGLQFQLQMSWQSSLLSQKHKNGLPPLRLRNLGNSCYLKQRPPCSFFFLLLRLLPCSCHQLQRTLSND